MLHHLDYLNDLQGKLEHFRSPGFPETGLLVQWRGARVRQGPRFSIRMVIGIFCSDTETGAVTPPGVMQKK